MKMANLTKEDIRSVIETIKELYLEDMIPWICGYSGGKDSTAVVQLVWYALQELPKEKLKKTVHVISTDSRPFRPGSDSGRHGSIPRSASRPYSTAKAILHRAERFCLC